MAEQNRVEVVAESGKRYVLDLDDELGAGAFGRVVGATESGGREPLAVKWFHRRDEEAAQRVRESIAVHKTLDHPRIQRMTDWGRYLKQPFIMMRRATTSLQHRMAAGRLGEEEALLHFYDTALGLLHLHEQGKVHRDIKPSNLLIDAEGRVCISDFDLVKDTKGLGAGTQFSSGIGTCAYRSPESW